MQHQHRNKLGQPIGFPVDNWQPPPLPPRTPMQGRYCRLEPLGAERHAQDLYAAFTAEGSDMLWTYLARGPFETYDAFEQWVVEAEQDEHAIFYAIVADMPNEKSQALGCASLMRIAPHAGSIEVGFIIFGPQLQRTTAATEAMYLLMRRAFDELGYRRYEWKCDALNAPSQAAAQRLGFVSEGVFRQALIYKGRNRDTAWFSIIDAEWPQIKRGMEAWLAPKNFDERGQQRASLQALIEGAKEQAP